MIARTPELLARKRDGGELDAGELSRLVTGYLAGDVSEGQMGAFLMAGVLRGFTAGEARALTQVLLDSGETLDLSPLDGPTVDKHSTGGVADGTTLVVAPLLAAAGAKLVKLSGRGLGHTGGTLDKLESIPGFRTRLDPGEMLRIAADAGCVVAAQTARLVPADKALYALRDVTATVPSPALIASSVMSKKLAAGAGTIVLDVKAGDGAFLPDVAAARELAELCVEIGTDAGRRCVALISAMDGAARAGGRQRPGGRRGRRDAVGLAAGTARRGGAGARDPRARAGPRRGWAAPGPVRRRRGAAGPLGGRLGAGAAASDGRRAGRRPGGVRRPRDVLPAAPVVRVIPAAVSGTVAAVPARAVGELAADLGAGRTVATDDVDPAVGLELRVEVGDRISAGDPLAVVHARDEAAAGHVTQRLRALVRLGDADPVPVLLDRVGHPPR